MNPSANPVIHLKIERRSNHPWIFQKMVEKPDPKPKPGSIVDIVDRDGTFAGRGFYNGHSRIALRVLTARPDEAVGTIGQPVKCGVATTSAAGSGPDWGVGSGNVFAMVTVAVWSLLTMFTVIGSDCGPAVSHTSGSGAGTAASTWSTGSVLSHE